MTETSDTKDNGASRRAIFAGAGAIGVAGMLAACGGDETPSGTSASTSTSTNGATPATTGATTTDSVLAKKSDIPVGGGKIIGDQVVVVTQPTAGKYECFSAMCTHQGCVVSSVSNGVIVCGCHNSQFSVTDGSVKKGPATKALEKKELKVDGDNLKLA